MRKKSGKVRAIERRRFQIEKKLKIGAKKLFKNDRTGPIVEITVSRAHKEINFVKWARKNYLRRGSLKEFLKIGRILICDASFFFIKLFRIFTKYLQILDQSFFVFRDCKFHRISNRKFRIFSTICS